MVLWMPLTLAIGGTLVACIFIETWKTNTGITAAWKRLNSLVLIALSLNIISSGLQVFTIGRTESQCWWLHLIAGNAYHVGGDLSGVVFLFRLFMIRSSSIAFKRGFLSFFVLLVCIDLFIFNWRTKVTSVDDVCVVIYDMPEVLLYAFGIFAVDIVTTVLLVKVLINSGNIVYGQSRSALPLNAGRREPDATRLLSKVVVVLCFICSTAVWIPPLMVFGAFDFEYPDGMITPLYGLDSTVTVMSAAMPSIIIRVNKYIHISKWGRGQENYLSARSHT